MARATREKMIEGAVELLATKGLHGTSLGDVIDATGAPRGSIYHHFPGGKDELIAAAVDATGDEYVRWMEKFVGASPDMVAGGFLQFWRHTLLRSDMKAGCPVLAVTVSTDVDDLIDHARDVFRNSRAKLAELMAAAGVEEEAAARFATIAVAGAEGAVVLARAERSITPFDEVADNLVSQVAALPRA
ncbi:TetR/AcrR family transcriptional regulator [Arthrobacter sp. NPDC056727]|uniref:TetR/AcrR family transcriptional regulator n=1 Tax=Arthrobacter sp. NPDC056727 TaxID=3345927 RepID=UPI003670B6AC